MRTKKLKITDSCLALKKGHRFVDCYNTGGYCISCKATFIYTKEIHLARIIECLRRVQHNNPDTPPHGLSGLCPGAPDFNRYGIAWINHDYFKFGGACDYCHELLQLGRSRDCPPNSKWWWKEFIRIKKIFKWAGYLECDLFGPEEDLIVPMLQGKGPPSDLECTCEICEAIEKSEKWENVVG